MKGKVWLVGAGPGDVGLFTLRGKQVLEQAEVVVYDALVGQEVLGLIPPDAELINVGKRANHHLMAQEDINELLLKKAQEGKRVVRLKGGDPFLFGRGGEELELLVEQGIDFEIVPGVTSAIAVPGYNGIPVTHRDFTQSVHVITGHRRSGKRLDIDFSALVATRGTLVFLMGLSTLPDIVSGLLEAGMDPDMPSAVLQQGTTARQRRVVAPLASLQERAREEKISTPAIIVVGEVCALSEQFYWAEKRPLAGKKILVTRPKELNSQMAKRLREKGAEVLELPTIRTQMITPNEPLRAVIDQTMEGKRWDWLIFTSPTGVRIFFDALMTIDGADMRLFGQTKIAAIGRATQNALLERGLRADLVPDVFDGRHLGLSLAAQLSEGSRVLIPRAALGSQELTEAISLVKDVEIVDIATYETVYEKSRVIDEQGILTSGDVDYVVFTSASTVRGFAEATKGADLTGVKAVCIGKQTEVAALELGMRTWVASQATMDSVVDKLVEICS